METLVVIYEGEEWETDCISSYNFDQVKKNAPKINIAIENKSNKGRRFVKIGEVKMFI